MKKETFLRMIEIYKQTYKRCEEFNNDLENIIKKPFNDSDYKNDATVMFFWPLQAVTEAFMAMLMDMGESKEGAEWFIFEGIDFIDNDKNAEIEENGKSYIFKSYEDYYNYLIRG